MRLLLDTCIFLWYINGDKNLPAKMKNFIINLDNDVYLSSVSIWESIVKYQIGKLSFPQTPENYLPEMRNKHYIKSLSLDEKSVTRLSILPSLHRDPFDRMIICQAIEHKLTLLTVDKKILSYPVLTYKG